MTMRTAISSALLVVAIAAVGSGCDRPSERGEGAVSEDDAVVDQQTILENDPLEEGAARD